MKLKTYLAAAAVLLLITAGCKDKGTNPPMDEKPPGYQEDIPWPSLADSPWPINRGDPQATGRSKFSGPHSGVIDWDYEETYGEIYGSLVVGDTAIYFNTTGGLSAVDLNGRHLWNVFNYSEQNKSVPIIRADGTVILIGHERIEAVSPEGDSLWAYELKGDSTFVQEMVNIGLDGKIYVTEKKYKTLYEFNSNGTVRWCGFINDLFANGNGSVVFSPNGKTLYLPGITKTIYAFDVASKTVKWSFGEASSQKAPLVDAQGNIYLSTYSQKYNNGVPAFFSLKPDGSVRWFYAHNNSIYYQPFAEPTMNKNGDVFFAYDTLHCVDYLGKLKWKIPLNGKTFVPLVCDVDGNIFVVVHQSLNDFNPKVYSYNPEGKVNWELQLHLPINTGPGESPALGVESLFYPTTGRYTIISIK